MYSNIGFISYGVAWLAYILLACALLVFWRNRVRSLAMIVAAVTTALWAGLSAFATIVNDLPGFVLQSAEVFRNAAWIFLLLSLYGMHLQGTNRVLGPSHWLARFSLGLALLVCILFAAPVAGKIFGLSPLLIQALIYTIWLTMSLVALLLIENIYRNSTNSDRWWVKFLCMGIGFLFVYDFFLYSGALILQELDSTLWQSRGFAVALTAPLVAVTAARSTDRPLNLKLSRHVIFHTFTLFAAGTYLMLMAVAGYFFSFWGGTWSDVLQITFLASALLFLLVLLLSSRVRARSRVWLSKNFFTYKYDYRMEWLEFTETLVDGADDTPQAIIQAMAKLGHCRAGTLWARSDHDRFRLLDEWPVGMSKQSDEFAPLASWLQASGWIIDVSEWRESPDMYVGLEMPPKLVSAPGSWMVIPLMFGKRLEGILFLRRTQASSQLDWEDRDLLKVAGRQAASHLAQYRAAQALVELRQFEAFNRLSAFVIHDLKNILAEQSLIVANASRHRGNLAFYDDVIETVSDSVARMNNLMAQMHSGMRETHSQLIELGGLLCELVAVCKETLPQLVMQAPTSELWVVADRERLATIFKHIIQNAGDATEKNGKVRVRLWREETTAVVEIEDNGSGMSEEFIRRRLFKPFDSTKGLTGMGIGAFESREMVRALGGNIEVRSQERVGSHFRIMLPCVEPGKTARSGVEEIAGE